MWRFRLVIITLSFLATGWAQAAPAPLTLSEAMLIALKENPGLKAAGLSLETAEAEVAKARARFLPALLHGNLQLFQQPLPGVYEQVEPAAFHGPGFPTAKPQ